MLQQTTVAAVIPFYERWMTRFPTLSALAEAPVDDVLRLWAGLGYYARARNLHRTAQIVTERHGGALPSDPKEILALPGIGRYTAGAILSIAHNQSEPILDTNVIRVLARVYTVTGDPKKSAHTQSVLWDLAREVIPDGRASDFNQAMMELGALVCTPAAPRCEGCPLNAICQAYLEGDPARYPELDKTRKWKDDEDVSIAVQNERGHFLVVQRPADDPLWGGLWELPRARRRPEETLEQCAARAAFEAAELTVPSVEQFGNLKHVVGNRRITLHGYRAQVARGAQLSQNGAWKKLEDFSGIAMATPQVRLVTKLKLSLVQGSLEF
ncbi:A/G-specific adenine glycosylase [Capsulimonas corticalis]|uniref:Adenine DNA glycosylase n=2 Tax=Capsulimonas corticalis TaxID=2219043 RepID=A0A402CXS4_9BACT|nr:A/G-specific adenine glycosylase [Capsulimonas corticalis]